MEEEGREEGMKGNERGKGGRNERIEKGIHYRGILLLILFFIPMSSLATVSL